MILGLNECNEETAYFLKYGKFKPCIRDSKFCEPRIKDYEDNIPKFIAMPGRYISSQMLWL
jgi:hypothetical protein